MKRLAMMLVAVCLAGCSSSSSSRSGPPSKTAPASTVASSATVVATRTAKTSTGPTVSQFASVVAKDEVAIQKAAANLKQCHGIYDFNGDNPLIICSLGWLTETLGAETLQLNLEDVGEPPVGIAPLVSDTLEAAKLLRKAEALQERYCVHKPNASLCQDATDTWVSAESQLQSELGGWRPYVH